MNKGPAESRRWRQLNGRMVQRGGGGRELNRGDLWEAQATNPRVTAIGKAKRVVVRTNERRTAVDLPTRVIVQNDRPARARPDWRRFAESERRKRIAPAFATELPHAYAPTWQCW